MGIDNPSIAEAPMFRRLKAAIPQEPGKWCVYVLVLLTPGSFIALPLLWLLNRARSRFA
jgi:hypothetical protein